MQVVIDFKENALATMKKIQAMTESDSVAEDIANALAMYANYLELKRNGYEMAVKKDGKYFGIEFVSNIEIKYKPPT